MKILFQVDFDDSQDAFSKEKSEILNCSFSLHDLHSFPTLLLWWIENRIFRDEDDYFNLQLWIDVLNKLDSFMDLIIRTLSSRAEEINANSNSNSSTIDNFDDGFASNQDLFSASKITLQWISSFLSCSFNKIVFNSVDVSELYFLYIMN